jgi:hypothetical protein
VGERTIHFGFGGLIKSPSRYGQKRYILIATEYITKWAKVTTTRTDDTKTVAKFIYENIITCFGWPKELISNKGSHFLNAIIE